MQTFLRDHDFALYREIMSNYCAKERVEIWSYCLMPNHAHLIAVPETEHGLSRAIGDGHQAYARAINKRERWIGHLWQARFASYPMDPAHTLAAARYIERNPVRAGIVESPAAYEWSSARAHLLGLDDGLVRVAPLLARRPDWGEFISENMDSAVLDELRAHLASGRPLGDEAFVSEIEARAGRVTSRAA
jgi:putative transposase